MKENIIDVLKSAQGGATDNLLRAKAAFRNYSEIELDNKYGQSSSTCREILEGYQASFDHYQKMIDWLINI